MVPTGAQRSTRPCGGNLHDSAVALRRTPQVHSTCLGRENELRHGALFPGTCTVLLPSSLLREAVPVLYASLTGHFSPLCDPPAGTGRDVVKFKRQPSKPCLPVFTYNKHYENSLVNPTYAGCESSFRPGLCSLPLVTSVRFPLFL